MKKVHLASREYKPPTNSIAFTPALVSEIKSGRKKLTYRLGLKYDGIQEGDVVDAINSDTKQVEAKIKITSKTQVKFSDLPLNIDGHGVYKSKEHQREVMNGYYSYTGREILDEDLFLVFKFTLLEGV